MRVRLLLCAYTVSLCFPVFVTHTQRHIQLYVYVFVVNVKSKQAGTSPLFAAPWQHCPDACAVGAKADN